MSGKLQVRRGTDTQRQTMILDSGELGYAQDTKQLYIGDGTTYGGNPVTSTQISFKNKFINGNFNFWQRGQSLAAFQGAAKLLADRWKITANGTTIAPSQQTFAPGQTAVPNGPAYFHRSVVASVAGAGNYAQQVQLIEGLEQFSGQTVTVSFWAKADAAKSIGLEIQKFYGTGGSPSAAENGANTTSVALTTAWQKFTWTFTVSSTAGKTYGTNGDSSLILDFWFDCGSSFTSRGTIGQQSGTFDIAQVQLESGSVATQFEVRPPQTELALCQRYYQLGSFSGVFLSSVGTQYQTRSFMQQMRATPAVTVSGYIDNDSAGTGSVASVATDTFGIISFVTASSATKAGRYFFNYTADAEL